MSSCSKCGALHNRKRQRYCAPCHAEYMREWRISNPPNPEMRTRITARTIAREYRKRGALVPQACEACGSPDSQMHHQDHERPLDVTWLCRTCHLDWHAFWRKASREAFLDWLSVKHPADSQGGNPDCRPADTRPGEAERAGKRFDMPAACVGSFGSAPKILGSSE